MILQLAGNKRVFLVGKTQSGKSFLARYLLKIARQQKWRIVIVDPKRDWMRIGNYQYQSEKQGGTVDNPVLVRKFNPSLCVQILHPIDWDTEMAQFCRDIMATGNTIIYFDEITQLVTASRAPREFVILWTQGAAINVGAWCGTQRPKNVPTIIKDQAEIWFIFRIANYGDRKVIGEYLPTDNVPELVDEPLEYRYFWFWEDSMEEPIKVRPLTIGGKAA